MPSFSLKRTFCPTFSFQDCFQLNHCNFRRRFTQFSFTANFWVFISFSRKPSWSQLRKFEINLSVGLCGSVVVIFASSSSLHLSKVFFARENRLKSFFPGLSASFPPTFLEVFFSEVASLFHKSFSFSMLIFYRTGSSFRFFTLPKKASLKCIPPNLTYF